MHTAFFFALRTPLLPFAELVGWAEGATDDPALLRERLRAFVDRPEVREGIFVSSPAVDELIPVWLADPESPRGRQCERALVRYLARMTGRPTPFGLLAGVSLGRVGDETRLELEPRVRYRRRSRLDAEYLLQVVEGLVASPEVRGRLSFRPNPSLYTVGGRRRYVRSQPGAEEQRHRLVSVRDTKALAETLAAAADGATAGQLVEGLAEGGADRERAQRYVDELIEEQVLVPDLGLQVTGADAVYGLAEELPALAKARDELAAIDAGGLGHAPDRYRRLAARLEELPAKLELHRLVQVDLAKASPAATLGREVVAEIMRGVELLGRIGRTREDPLVRFRERFADRFETRPVPLLEALDPDLGIGFDGDDDAPAPLLAGIRGGEGRPRLEPWGPQDKHLLARLTEVQAAGLDELVLTHHDLEKLERADAPPLPDACAALAAVASRSRADLERGRFRVLIAGVDGPSGARLLGRFCHTDERLREAVEEHLRAEEALDPDAIYAEVVHLPRARDVNVVARPLLRPYELECLGRSGAPAGRRIPLDDLLVSLASDRLVLRSRRLGRRVVPRLTSAHNFSRRGVSVYRFLCHLQAQGSASRSGVWGPLGSAPFLPRVRAGRVVLELARWRLTKDDVDTLEEWRRAHRVPRLVALTDFGGQMPVDLDNVLAVDSLVHMLRARDHVDLVELFPPPDELCAFGPEGTFSHELVVPLVRARPTARHAPRVPAADTPVRRTFPPGADWPYARLYTGETLADAVLTETIAPLVASLGDRWFFLRYREPEFHLRIRLQGAGARAPLEAAASELLERGLAWRVELGTYEREVERYGGPEAIELAEELFHADSDAVLGILRFLEPGAAGQEERWRLGLAGVHLLLVDLGLDAPARLALVRRQRDGLVARLRWDGATLARAGERFRRERPLLERLLRGDATELEPGLALLRERSRRIRPLCDELGRLDREGRLVTPLAEIAGSLLHMHLNRLLRGNNLAQEAVVCDFLARLCDAEGRRSGRGA